MRTCAECQHDVPGASGWKYEGAIIDVVGKFIKSLPKE
jgi:hypothetical protein